MTTDFSLMDIMGNFTGGSVSPDLSTDVVSTATTQAVTTPEVVEKKPSFVNPKFMLKTAAVAPVAGVEPAAVAPAVSGDYNARIAQAESGGRADIGFHAPGKSTAFGPYGITAGAYQDARKVNPALPEDITQANPEQMTQAQNSCDC